MFDPIYHDPYNKVLLKICQIQQVWDDLSLLIRKYGFKKTFSTYHGVEHEKYDTLDTRAHRLTTRSAPWVSRFPKYSHSLPHLLKCKSKGG